MHRFTSRLGAAIAMTAAIGVATATTAAAHECYNASRSDKGNMKAAANSNTWYNLVLSDIVAEEIEADMYDAATGECILAAWEAGGLPESFVIKVVGGKDGLIAGGVTRQELLDNGKGIDHAFAAYGDVIVGGYIECGVPFGE